MVGHGNGAIEVAKTVLEVADVAWTAIETHHHHHDPESMGDHNRLSSSLDDKLDSLRSENRRLRSLLEQNIKLLQNLSQTREFPNDIPPDLHARVVSTVDSNKFLSQLKSLRQVSEDGTCGFSFKEATGDDSHAIEMLVNVDLEEPSWWVFVTDDMVPSTIEEWSGIDDMVPSTIEEWSGIDDESYIIVSEEHVVEGIANFMARCILSNPKAETLTPEELQKTLSKALSGMNKLEKMLHIWHAGTMIYGLSTWGLALVGLYRSRAILKLAAKVVHTTSKLVLKAL